MIRARNPVARNPVREVAAVAAALLLPVPLLAATAVRLPLPAAVERGLASVTPGGSLDVPVREAMPAEPDATPAELPARGGARPSNVGGQGVSSASSVTVLRDSGSNEKGTRSPDRPQGGGTGGGTVPTETQPPDTGSEDTPGGDSPSPDAPPREGPPAEPDTPPATAAQAEPPDELAVGLDAGEVSAEVEAGDDGVDVTVSAGDLLPETTLPLPLPVPLGWP